MFRPQDVISEHFEIVEMVNEGNVCSIFTARDKRSAELVAVKQPKFEEETDLKREYDLLLRLVPFTYSPTPLEFGRTSDSSYYAMTLEGQNLKELAQMYSNSFDDRTISLILFHCLVAVQHMHKRGVCHGDLTLANVCIPKTPSKGRILLIDFGSSIDHNPMSARLDVSAVLKGLKSVSQNHRLLAECRSAHDKDFHTSIKDLIGIIEDAPDFDPNSNFQWEDS